MWSLEALGSYDIMKGRINDKCYLPERIVLIRAGKLKKYGENY